MSKTFKDILDKIGGSTLNEDAKSAILGAFNQAVEEKVQQKVKLQVEEAVRQLDEDHGNKLQDLLQTIDRDHTNKLHKVLHKVDEEYAGKLQRVIEHYEKTMRKEAAEFRDSLTTEMSNYMDLYLDSMIPADQIREAVENTHARQVLGKIKDLVAIDEDYITDTIRGALSDGKQKMEELSAELTEAVKSNMQINQELKRTKANLMLEKKTADFDRPRKEFIMRVLRDKSPEEIEENFDYVVEMFNRDEAKTIEILAEQERTKVRSTHVDVPKSDLGDDIITESTQKPRSMMDNYLSELKEY